MSELRVGFVCEFPTLSGGERALLDLMERLPRSGVSGVCLCPDGGPLAEEIERRGLAREPFDLARFKSRGPEFKEAAARELVDVASRLELHHLHANSLSLARTTGHVAAISEIPCSAHVRDIRKLNRAYREQIGCNRFLVVVSRAVERSLLEEGVDATILRHVPDGVDGERFRPDRERGRLRSELGLDDGAFLVGCIGQISVRKGQKTLLRAATLCFDEIPSARIVIVGERFSRLAANREYHEELLSLASRPPLEDRVHWVGFREDIEDLLVDLDVLCHPAHQEPLSCVVLEACAAETPVVATAVGGTPEIVDPGETGLLVPRGDAEALAGALSEVARNPVRAREMGREARIRCLERFDPDRAARCLAELLRAASGGKN